MDGHACKFLQVHAHQHWVNVLVTWCCVPGVKGDTSQDEILVGTKGQHISIWLITMFSWII